MTNREKLAQMSDEELGEFLCEYSHCGDCIARDMCVLGHAGLIDWLKAEAKEEG